jgi:hypothetical protein
MRYRLRTLLIVLALEFRPMFRFTIRELVLLTLVVAFGVGWWLDRRGLAIHYADYERLKADERKALAERKEFFEILRKASHAAAAQLPPNNLQLPRQPSPDQP